MNPKNLITFSFYLLSVCLHAQVDNIGSGRAIKFNGAGSYIRLGDTYHDVNLPFTVSAWIYLDPSNSTPSAIFVSNDNTPTYRGFWFFISGSQLWCEFGDGTGASLSTYRRGKMASVSNVLGRWINVCAVMKAPYDIQLYINGINVGGNSSGDSSRPMASSYPGDTPKIGHFLSNNVTYGFNGLMDEVRLWKRALTENEVRTSMCVRLAGNESDLIGYWNFDETTGNIVYDKTAGAHHGTFVGNPVRVFSGAPVGDKSTFRYLSNWTNVTVSQTENQDNVVVSNIQGNPEGIQIYEVSSLPNQMNGLSAISPTAPYFGVFVASLDNNNVFDLEYNYNGIEACNILKRNDNSGTSWVSVGSPAYRILQRGEFVKSLGKKVRLDLGPDLSVCNQNSVVIASDTTNAGFGYLWNTGQTTPAITVSSSGKYWLRIVGGCNVAVDTINVKMSFTPVAFSLGNDELICPFVKRRIQPYNGSTNLEGLDFTWQDGSKKSYFDVLSYGKYWVSVKNSCGEVRDSVSFQMPGKEINLDLGPDKATCDQRSLPLSTNVTDDTYTYLWSTGATSPGIVATKSGKYWLKITDGCRIKQDTISVKISSQPTSIDLGESEMVCPLVPRILQFDYTLDDLSFTWQDGSIQPDFNMTEYGEYWVVAKNSCGEAKGSISFVKPPMEIKNLPNVITPNGDTYNQFLYFDTKKYGSVSLLVLNRWGESVFYSSDYKNDWDGKDISSGTYFYTLRGECFNDVKSSLSILK